MVEDCENIEEVMDVLFAAHPDPKVNAHRGITIVDRPSSLDDGELNKLYFRTYYANNKKANNARQNARWAKHKNEINAKRKAKRFLAKQITTEPKEE